MHLDILKLRRQTRINHESVKLRLDAQDALADGVEIPGGRSGQPAVPRLARREAVPAIDGLAVDIRLSPVQLLILNVCRCNALIQIKCGIAMSQYRFADDDPGIVVTEYRSILLVTRYVRGNLTEIQIVL